MDIPNRAESNLLTTLRLTCAGSCHWFVFQIICTCSHWSLLPYLPDRPDVFICLGPFWVVCWFVVISFTPALSHSFRCTLCQGSRASVPGFQGPNYFAKFNSNYADTFTFSLEQISQLQHISCRKKLFYLFTAIHLPHTDFQAFSQIRAWQVKTACCFYTFQEMDINHRKWCQGVGSPFLLANCWTPSLQHAGCLFEILMVQLSQLGNRSLDTCQPRLPSQWGLGKVWQDARRPFEEGDRHSQFATSLSFSKAWAVTGSCL